MAQLTQEQLKKLLDSGLTLAQINQMAARRGDVVPGPTILGSVAQPFYTAALRTGQAVGAVAGRLLGASEEQAQRAGEKATVQKFPLLGTLATEGQKPLSTPRGREQVGGLGLETGGTLFPVGRVGRALSSRVGTTLGYAGSLGTSGYGIETGYKLQRGEEKPFTPGLGTFIPAGIPIAGKAISLSANTLRFGFAKANSISQDTLTTILTRPQAIEEAQKIGVNRMTLGNMLESRFKQLTDELSETGVQYRGIRQNKTALVDIPESPVLKTLAKYGIGIEDGRLITTAESPPLSGGDVSALERFIAQYGLEQRLSSNAFLNARKALDDLSDWQRDPSRTDQLETISRDLRREYDTLGKKQIPGLKDVDEKTAPLLKEVKELRREYLQYRDGQWGLKDTALSRITNATNKGREEVLKRLEKYVPGVTQQIQIVRALEDISSAREGAKVGAYLQSILLGGGVFAASANPVLALTAALVALPQLSIPILLAFGKANGIAKGLIRDIIGKIVQGKSFTDREMMLFRQAVIQHLNEISPGDQFVSSPLGQRALAYAGDYVKNPRIGLQLRDITKNPLPEDGFQGFQDLSTKLLEKLKGRTTVSRQFIEDLSNSPDLKQPEKDLIRNMLSTEGKDVSVPDFANKVKSELLPLKRGIPKGEIFRGDTSKITLDELDTTKVFNPAEKEALGAFNNTPGLYFTDSLDNAKSYGQNITKVSVSPNSVVIDIKDTPKILKRSDVEKIVRSNPRINDWAMNWDENFDKAIKQITDSVMSEKDGNEFLKAIWSDGGFSESDFIVAMKGFGIDGIKVKKDDVNHYVIYNKDILK